MSLRFGSWSAAVAALLLGVSAVYAQTPANTITITAPTTVAEPASGNTDSSAISFSVAPPYTERTEVPLSAGSASTATVGSGADFQFRSGGSDSDTVTVVFPANTAAASTSVQLRVFADNLNEGDETVVLSIGGATHTVTITDDADATKERQARAMALATITNQAVERLGSDIIRGRLTHAAAARPPGNARSLTVAGRRISTADEAGRKAAAGPWAANPHQRAGLQAQAPAAGGALTMAEMLNTSAFSLSSVNDTLTIWGAGGRSSVSGTIPAIVGGSATTYDGDNTAFHIGAETWVRDALLAGVTLGYTVGDLDWTADRRSGKIRSAMTSVHPYWARWLSDVTSLWLSLGYGASNLKYTEDTATAAPKLTTMMASGGLTSRSDVFDAADVALNITAAWVSSDLGGATLSNGAALNGSHSTAVRLGSEWEFGYTVDTPGGELRLFATAGARKDYKDANDTIAYELGGGLHWTDGQGLSLSLETTRQLDGSARYEENHISARMSLDTAWQGFGLAPFTRMAIDEAGDRKLAGGLSVRAGKHLTLSLETALSDANRADYRNLFSGEWRF